MDALLDIRNLEVRLALREGVVRAVNGVNLRLAPRRTLGLVGESGCGKSMAARAILRILPPRGEIASGEIWLAPREDGGTATDLARLPVHSKAMRRIRGGDISMIFQEPMSSLSPVHTVGNQIAEAVRLHQHATRAQALERAIEMLGLAGVPRPEQRVNAYPNELSGGLRQRVMIAMALCCRPRLLIADEPTTALDVTIQGQILALIRRLQREFGMAMLMITHDMGVIAETADEVAVMYLGRIAEHAPSAALFARPKHPYTAGLLESVPRLGQDRSRRLKAIPGSVPGPFEHIPGCPFHPRCPRRMPGLCDTGEPPKLRNIPLDPPSKCDAGEPPKLRNIPLDPPSKCDAGEPPKLRNIPLDPPLKTGPTKVPKGASGENAIQARQGLARAGSAEVRLLSVPSLKGDQGGCCLEPEHRVACHLYPAEASTP